FRWPHTSAGPHAVPNWNAALIQLVRPSCLACLGVLLCFQQATRRFLAAWPLVFLGQMELSKSRIGSNLNLLCFEDFACRKRKILNPQLLKPALFSRF